MRIDAADRRTLVVGALVLTTILVVGKGVPEARAWESSRLLAAELAERRLQSARALLAEDSAAGALGTSADDAAETSARGALVARTPDEAAASLARIVEDAAADAGVRISSNALRADSTFADRHSVVSTRIVATADVAGLMSLLNRLERSARLVRVSELAITQPEPAADERTPESLRLELTVEALARPVPQRKRDIP